MKTTKKLLTLALAAMLLLSLAVPAMAADSDFLITIEDEDEDYLGCWLVGYLGPGGDVVIPDTVTHIGNSAFYEQNSVTSVTIPSSVTEIGIRAFAYCNNLKSVIIPSSVTIIYEYAFAFCPSLTDVYFGGTEAQWKGYIDANADILLGSMFDDETEAHVTIHYNSTGPDTPTTPETPTTPSFGDVPADAWYAKPVAWAVEKGITNGTSKDTFSPEKTCNNAEILTFLWRACDKPEAPAASFSDVDSGVWYADAANWAKSKGMISGDKLSPDTPCTRASAVMFIWQAMGKPAASKTASFSDVPADSDYAAAVAWAVEKGVTNGTGADTFSPDDICTRGHIVTFLQRAYAE